MFGRKPKDSQPEKSSGQDPWTEGDSEYRAEQDYDTNVIPDDENEAGEPIETPVNPAPVVKKTASQPLLIGLGITGILFLAGAGAYLAFNSGTQATEESVMTPPVTPEEPTQMPAEPPLIATTDNGEGEQVQIPTEQTDGESTPVTEESAPEETPTEKETQASGNDTAVSPAEKQTVTTARDPFRLLTGLDGNDESLIGQEDTTPAAFRQEALPPVSVIAEPTQPLNAPPVDIQLPVNNTVSPPRIVSVAPVEAVSQSTPAPRREPETALVTVPVMPVPVQSMPSTPSVKLTPAPIQVQPSLPGNQAPGNQPGQATTDTPVNTSPAVKPPSAAEIARTNLINYVSTQSIQFNGLIGGTSPQAVLNISGQEIVVEVGEPIPGTRVTLRQADTQKATITMDNVSTELPISQTGGTQ